MGNCNNTVKPVFIQRWIIILLFIVFQVIASGQVQTLPMAEPGFAQRISEHIDTISVIDTHEHLLDPEILKDSYFLDFSMLFQQNGYDDLVSAGMPDSLYDYIFNYPASPEQKWQLISPFWAKAFNTSFNRIILNSTRDLYNVGTLNDTTVRKLSEKIRTAYESDWFNRILRDSCRIRYLIKDGGMIQEESYVRYAARFDDWLLVRSKYRIDSLAILQLDPIFSLDDYIKSLRNAFEKEFRNGMISVKIFTTYYRTLQFNNVTYDEARKVFRSLVNGEEDYKISYEDAKPLQDFMLHRLLDLAEEYRIPVTIHTGIQAGKGKVLGHSDPTLLTNLFMEYPDIRFVLFHGSYPYGGELSALAKNFRNVYIDMNWMYAVSPSYAKRYLLEWIEMVPVSRLIAFGGDCMVVENVYSELKIAKKIIAEVLIEKVSQGYFSEAEAKKIVSMMFYENAARLYNLPLRLSDP